eukprot:TRINITY_DN29964_c0_g1_i1.p1 TRINITY_DN29964_c0_g1~~TRINITY_DN29964_c0_g1_i1.p1  ORF type:complete len:141 (-),score=21.07 TRINITY_DN29964_c0_g1_i1:548-970(-)
MATFEMSDRKKIGIGLTAFGVLFTCLGVMFFFDKGLLAMGNILFLAGMMLTIGFQDTISFFLRKKNRRGSAFFLSGFALVVFGWAILGMIIQSYGFIVLFSGFWPTFVYFLRRVPVLGWLLSHPFFKQYFGKYQEGRLPP